MQLAHGARSALPRPQCAPGSSWRSGTVRTFETPRVGALYGEHRFGFVLEGMDGPGGVDTRFVERDGRRGGGSLSSLLTLTVTRSGRHQWGSAPRMGPPPPRRVDDLSPLGQRESVPLGGGTRGGQEGVEAREEEVGRGGGQVGSVTLGCGGTGERDQEALWGTEKAKKDLQEIHTSTSEYDRGRTMWVRTQLESHR